MNARRGRFRRAGSLRGRTAVCSGDGSEGFPGEVEPQSHSVPFSDRGKGAGLSRCSPPNKG